MLSFAIDALPHYADLAQSGRKSSPIYLCMFSANCDTVYFEVPLVEVVGSFIAQRKTKYGLDERWDEACRSVHCQSYTST